MKMEFPPAVKPPTEFRISTELFLTKQVGERPIAS